MKYKESYNLISKQCDYFIFDTHDTNLMGEYMLCRNILNCVSLIIQISNIYNCCDDHLSLFSNFKNNQKFKILKNANQSELVFSCDTQIEENKYFQILSNFYECCYPKLIKNEQFLKKLKSSNYINCPIFNFFAELKNEQRFNRMQKSVHDKIEDDFDSNIIRLNRNLKALNVKKFNDFKKINKIKIYKKYLKNEKLFKIQEKLKYFYNFIALDNNNINNDNLIEQTTYSEMHLSKQYNFVVTFMFLFFTFVFFGIYFLFKSTYYAYKRKYDKKRSIRIY